jgi:hypothetical protein
MSETIPREAIPSLQMETLHAEAGAAVSLALAGEPKDGLVLILEGLVHAQADYAEEPWGSQLIACYQRAAQAFSVRYQVETPLPRCR